MLRLKRKKNARKKRIYYTFLVAVQYDLKNKNRLLVNSVSSYVFIVRLWPYYLYIFATFPASYLQTISRPHHPARRRLPNILSYSLAVVGNIIIPLRKKQRPTFNVYANVTKPRYRMYATFMADKFEMIQILDAFESDNDNSRYVREYVTQDVERNALNAELPAWRDPFGYR